MEGKEINASIDVTLERTHVTDGGSAKIAAGQIGDSISIRKDGLDSKILSHGDVTR